MRHDSVSSDEQTAALLRVATYLGQPQKFMAIADARAEMRRTVELAAKGSVVLTTHGEPAAAVVPFTTLEDMRRALLHLLVAEMEATFMQTRDRLRSRPEEVPESSEKEIEALVGQTLRKARLGRKRGRKVPRR
jgi:antitoxin (DNA-binding transcriptional repressor) of toxin-antitoxin stability system